jgi:hypothetical protein
VQDRVDQVQAFVLGGVQDLEILFDRRHRRRAGQQLVVSHAEPRRGVQVVNVLVIDEGSRFSHQRVDHMAEVDGLSSAAEQPRQPFHALVLVPQFEVVLFHADFYREVDIFAAHRVHIPFDAQQAVGLDDHQEGGIRR